MRVSFLSINKPETNENRVSLKPLSMVPVPHTTLVQHQHIFEIHRCSSVSDGFQHIQEHVSTNAFDSDQPCDAAKCHPNTRIAILHEIMAWITSEATRRQWILWVNGAAGGGKSTIARSIVELCLKNNIPIARFFFCSTDSTGNNTKPLVATIAHQIMHQIPELKSILIPKIEDDPLIFKKSLRTQFEKLIFGPLSELAKQSRSRGILVLLFDGLDECIDKDEQTNLIRTISKFMGPKGFRVVAFFGSRNEPHLTSVFKSKYISRMLLEKQLHNVHSSDADIRLFLHESLLKIKETHGLRHLLKPSWPTQADVDSIADKSSGQFIYASSAIKFVSDEHRNPAEQLEILHVLRPSGGINPFAEVDALYHSIFSRLQERDLVIDILAWILITKGPDNVFGHGWKACALLLNVEPDAIPTALMGLSSVISSSGDQVEFLHASLPDFLCDKARAQSFFIDIKSKSTHFAQNLLRALTPPSRNSPTNENSTLAQVIIIDLCILLESAEITPDLKTSIFSFYPYALTLCDRTTLKRFKAVVGNLNLDKGKVGQTVGSFNAPYFVPLLITSCLGVLICFKCILSY